MKEKRDGNPLDRMEVWDNAFILLEKLLRSKIWPERATRHVRFYYIRKLGRGREGE
jgi:hypothetical protein